jgi:malonyl-CoA decarboxylase
MMNSTPEWIARSVSRLRTAAPVVAGGVAGKAAEKMAEKPAEKPADRPEEKAGKSLRAGVDKTVTDVVAKPAVARSTHERLQATLRRGQ